MESIVSYPDRGQYGCNSYRGNCSGLIIKDVIQQYKLKGLSDFMVGSGTTEDVVREAGIRGDFADLNRGYDMLSMDIPNRAENIFWHPPYGCMIRYADSQYKASDVERATGLSAETIRRNDLSSFTDWNEFVKMMNYCMMKQFTALEKGGRMFVLMGDMKKKGKLYSMLCDVVKPGTLEQIVIKMQHNCVSSRTQYSGKFISIVHEYLMILRKDAALMFPISLPRTYNADLRDMANVGTWRDVLTAILKDQGSKTLSEIYEMVDGHKKARTNPHWREKIRQTLQRYSCFRSDTKGVWALAS